MNRLKSASILVVAAYLLGPSMSWAQNQPPIPMSPVQQTQIPATQVGADQVGQVQGGEVHMAKVTDSQSPATMVKAEMRTAEIESVRSDIADLSKFEHDHEQLPKCIYKRDYVDKRKVIPVIAGHPQPDYGVGHHM
ncbi:MAG TPA: hypothetical protein V6C76_01035 [Drouetiella sp.]